MLHFAEVTAKTLLEVLFWKIKKKNIKENLMVETWNLILKTKIGKPTQIITLLLVVQLLASSLNAG